MYVLGIDGGGTKTTGVISDEQGKVVAWETVGASNQNGAEISVVKGEFNKLFSSLKRQNEEAFSRVTTVFAGMSGVDRPDAKKVINSIISELSPSNVSIIIDNDGVNALYSGTLGNPGIVQIAGTGSISFGINNQGERGRVGGWGYLIDDDGSGYSIGRDALIAVYRSFDERGSKTILTEKILHHFQVSSPPDLVKLIYAVGKSREMVSPISKLVVEAADEGDMVANHILQQSGEKIAESIVSLIRKLFSKHNGTIPVVLVGGVFNRDDLFIPIIESNIENSGLNVIITKPVIQPVGGAVIAALKHSNLHIPEGYTNNFNDTKLHTSYL